MQSELINKWSKILIIKNKQNSLGQKESNFGQLALTKKPVSPGSDAEPFMSRT